MSENVQNIRQSHKMRHKSHGKMRNGISRRVNFNRDENSGRHYLGRFTPPTAIC